MAVKMTELESEEEEELLINKTVSPSREILSLKKRITVFSVAMLCIFAEYLYFTIPISFLTNEILEVCNFNMNFFFRTVHSCHLY